MQIFITSYPPCYTLYGRTLRVKTSGKNIEYNTNLLEAIIYVKDMRKMRRIGKNTPSVKTLLAELEDMHTDGLTPKLATVYRHLDKKDTKTEAQAVADHNVLMGRLEIGQRHIQVTFSLSDSSDHLGPLPTNHNMQSTITMIFTCSRAV